jgi:hypothetical protein
MKVFMLPVNGLAPSTIAQQRRPVTPEELR